MEVVVAEDVSFEVSDEEEWDNTEEVHPDEEEEADPDKSQPISLIPIKTNAIARINATITHTAR